MKTVINQNLFIFFQDGLWNILCNCYNYVCNQGFREAFVNFRVKIRIQFDEFFLSKIFQFSEHLKSGALIRAKFWPVIWRNSSKMSISSSINSKFPETEIECSDFQVKNEKKFGQKKSSNWMRILTRKLTKASLNPWLHT